MENKNDPFIRIDLPFLEVYVAQWLDNVGDIICDVFLLRKEVGCFDEKGNCHASGVAFYERFSSTDAEEMVEELVEKILRKASLHGPKEFGAKVTSLYRELLTISLTGKMLSVL